MGIYYGTPLRFCQLIDSEGLQELNKRMVFNGVKQFVIILLSLQGLCFTMVEATEQ